MTAANSEFIAIMYTFAERLREEYDRAAADAGLTAQQAIVLPLLSEPVPMRGLAERRHCDPSNITGIVDRLERKGLVARTVDAADRRVKRVALTPTGQAMVDRFQAELERASFLATLTAEQRRLLLAAIPPLAD
jgi:DNA-binding MarR family transcriptional regulator